MSEELEASILLVDDEEEFLKVLSERLESRGMKVDTSTTGESAIEKAKARGFDAIVVDLAMPGVDGMETLKHIKSENPDVQIIMLTGHATVDKSVEAIREGAVDFMEKPVDLPKLLKKIEEAKNKRVLIVEKQHEEKIKKILKSKGW